MHREIHKSFGRGAGVQSCRQVYTLMNIIFAKKNSLYAVCNLTKYLVVVVSGVGNDVDDDNNIDKDLWMSERIQ